MRVLASLALLAGMISALPIDSAISTSAVTDTASNTASPATDLGKEGVSDYGPPRGSYDGGRYDYNYNYNSRPPPPRQYGYGNNGGPIVEGFGEIANGVGSLIGGTLGGVTGGFVNGFEAGAHGGRGRGNGYGYRRVKRGGEQVAEILFGVGRKVGGWVEGKR